MARPSAEDVFGLAGKVCVITGGGSGIGRAIATTLAAAGGIVAVLDRDATGAHETLALVTEDGGRGIALGCDIADPASVEAAAAAVETQLGTADVLVNNAGIIKPGALETLSLADWNGLLAVNLTGYFLCSQAFGRPMLAKGSGALVHTSSIASICATPYSGAYSVSKAGVTMLSRLLALEWGPRGVRSNAVMPGMIQTPLVKEVYATPGIVEKRSAVVPSRRVGQPQDIAEAVLYLASPRSSYVNGTELLVDGGFAQTTMTYVPRTGFEPPKS